MTCGNGLLESCRLVSCSGALCDRKEECEEPLAGESCESIGYAAGTLACSACAYDASECTSCLPGSSVLGCQVLSGYTTSRSIALETTTQEVAVAWDQGGREVVSRAYFARFSPDLTRLSMTGPLEVELAWIDDLSLAPLGSGWLLVTSHVYGSILYRTDAAGTPLRTAELDADWARAVSVPGGRPLLVWRKASMFQTALIADDGTPLSPVQSFTAEIQGHPQITFVGDGFLFAAGSAEGIAVGRLGPDGSFDGKLEHPAGSSVLGGDLIGAGTGAVLLYYDPHHVPGRLHWMRLDSRGALVSGPTVLDGLYGAGMHPAGAGSPERFVIALSTPPTPSYQTGPQTLVAFPLTASGVPSEPTAIAKDRRGFFVSRLARIDDQLFAAWVPYEGKAVLARTSL
jgi:hypothetical protein